MWRAKLGGVKAILPKEELKENEKQRQPGNVGGENKSIC